MVKRILVATDGSRYSRHAFLTAIEYAQSFGAEIELFHVVVEPHSFATYSGGHPIELPQAEIDARGDKVFNKTMEDIDTKQISVTKKAVVGFPAETIIDELEDGEYDLVIMGSRGYSPLLGAFIGSVAQRVIARANCPVLVLK